MPHLDLLAWAVLGAGAALAGFSKTGISGAGVLAAALFALVLPARESTGLLLPLLICGDVIGVAVYRRSANWRLIGRLMPWVLVGIALGVVFMARVRSNEAMRVSIGVMILVVLGAQVVVGGRLKEQLVSSGDHVSPAMHLAAASAGVGVGFATMVANAAGAIMTIYLLLSGVAMLEFLGTGAWFFFIVNVLKLPFSIGLGLVHPSSLTLDLALLPALGIGAAIGVALIRRIEQRLFERVTLAMAALSAAFLLG